MVKDLPAVQETGVQSLSQKDPLEEGHGNPLQCSCLEKPMDRGAWRVTVHGVAKRQTRLSDQHFFSPLTKGPLCSGPAPRGHLPVPTLPPTWVHPQPILPSSAASLPEEH